MPNKQNLITSIKTPSWSYWEQMQILNSVF